jgi:hypothetical protein
MSSLLFPMSQTYPNFLYRTYAHTATPRNLLSCRPMPIQQSMMRTGSLCTHMWPKSVTYQLQISMPRQVHLTQQCPLPCQTVFRGIRTQPWQVIHVTPSLWHMACLLLQCTISILIFTIALLSRQRRIFACLWHATVSILFSQMTIVQLLLWTPGS